MKSIIFIDLCLILILSFCVTASAFPSSDGYTVVNKPSCMACHQVLKASDLKEVIPLSKGLLSSTVADSNLIRNQYKHTVNEVNLHDMKRDKYFVTWRVKTVFKVPWSATRTWLL